MSLGFNASRKVRSHAYPALVQSRSAAHDNPALAAAIARGGPIVPVFVLDDLDAGEWAPGGASRWWLHGSLRALDDSLRQRGAAAGATARAG